MTSHALFNPIMAESAPCAAVCHLLVMLFACFTKTAWSECMNGLVKGLIFTLVILTVFRDYERAVSDGNFMPVYPHFIGGPSRGLDAQTIVKPSQEYWCGLKQFLSLTCEARQASRKCMENAIDSRLQNQQLLLIT